MRCESCGTEFKPKRTRGRFCSGRCRVAGWQAKQRREARAPVERTLLDLVGRLEELAAEAREVLTGSQGPTA